MSTEVTNEVVVRCNMCKEPVAAGRERPCSACKVRPGGCSPRDMVDLINGTLRKKRDPRRVGVKPRGAALVIEIETVGDPMVFSGHVTRAEAYAFLLGFAKSLDRHLLF